MRSALKWQGAPGKGPTPGKLRSFPSSNGSGAPLPTSTFWGSRALFFLWYVTTEYFKLPWFRKLPGPVSVFKEWTSHDPAYGISIYTPEYYSHILKSIWRVVQAFFLATFLGVPVGLFMGWKKTFKDYTFPLLETLRPYSHAGLGAAVDPDVARTRSSPSSF